MNPLKHFAKHLALMACAVSFSGAVLAATVEINGVKLEDSDASYFIANY